VFQAAYGPGFKYNAMTVVDHITNRLHSANIRFGGKTNVPLDVTKVELSHHSRTNDLYSITDGILTAS